MDNTRYAKRRVRLQEDIAAVMRLFTDDTGRRVLKLTAEWVSPSDDAPEELRFKFLLDDPGKNTAARRSPG